MQTLQPANISVGYTPSTFFDPRLTARGVEVQRAVPVAGRPIWRLVEARWLDTQEAIHFGPNHHILVDTWDEQGRRITNVTLIVTWPSDSARITTKGNNGYPWAADYPLSPSLNEFSIGIIDVLPSDRVVGIGMGKDGNPGEHTSTLLVFQRTTHAGGELPGGPTVPDPPLPGTLDPVLEALARARDAIDRATEIYSRQTGGGG